MASTGWSFDTQAGALLETGQVRTRALVYRSDDCVGVVLGWNTGTDGSHAVGVAGGLNRAGAGEPGKSPAATLEE